MFKGIVTKLAKEAWDNAAKPAPQPKPQAASQSEHVEQVAEAIAEPEVATDIEFPYYPGEGTACGAECRCRWQVQVRWSDEYQSRATFAHAPCSRAGPNLPN